MAHFCHPSTDPEFEYPLFHEAFEDFPAIGYTELSNQFPFRYKFIERKVFKFSNLVLSKHSISPKYRSRFMVNSLESFDDFGSGIVSHSKKI